MTTPSGITPEGNLTRDYAQVARDPDATNSRRVLPSRGREATRQGRKGSPLDSPGTLEVDKPRPPRSRNDKRFTRDQP